MPLSQIETASLSSALVAPTAIALTTASGSAPSYSARAWVNFNGTGTVAIRASGNVSSIADNGTGDYTVNFTTAMPDTLYGIAGFCGVAGAGVSISVMGASNFSQTTASCRLQTLSNAGVFDPSTTCVSIFR